MKQHQYLISAIFKITILALAIICFGQISAQQQLAVQAKILNPLSNTIAAQHQNNATNLYFRRDMQACSKLLSNPDYLNGRCKRMANFAQGRNLRDFFRGCSVQEIAQIFNYHLAHGNITELGIVQQYGLYTNPAFLAYIATLPSYPKHIHNLYSQAHHCDVCKKRIAKHWSSKLSLEIKSWALARPCQKNMRYGTPHKILLKNMVSRLASS